MQANDPAATDLSETDISGLQFVSHYAIKDDRTSLALTPDKPLKLAADFSLDFDVRFGAAVHTFGYVFRLILNGRTNFDMVSEMGDEPTVAFIHGQKSVAEFRMAEEIPGFDYDRWIHVSVRVDRARDSIVLAVGGIEKRIAASLESPRAEIWFGVCDHDDFYTTDVPLIAVRDIRIRDEHDKLVRHWKLGRHAENTVYDEKGHPARVVNPIWLIDGYAHWEKRLSESVPQGYLQVAADSESGKLYFAGGNYVGVYDNSSTAAVPALEPLAVKNRLPFVNMSNQLLFDPTARRLTTYEFDTHGVSVLDSASLRWSAADSVRPMPQYWHHNSAFIPTTNRFVTFGGYGEHTYKSLLSVVETDATGRAVSWKSIDLSEKLPPRYLSGMAVEKDGKLLVAGGYGSVTGLQSEGPHNYYDLLRIDPANGSVEPLVELTRRDVEKHFVFGRDMVLSENGKTVYALVYSDKRYASQIALIGIDLETGRATPYADYVPYEFTDIESFCTLAHDRKKNELLLVQTRLTSENQTRVQVWSLKYPPLSIIDTTQPERSENKEWWWIGGGALLLLIGGCVLLRRRKSPAQAGAQPATAVPKPKTETTDYYNIYCVEKRPSSILLLGGFQVVDKKGKDITGSFTQMVRALFLLILLDTFKNGRGISSQELKDILWFDKDSENARNNRNVNMHKLRQLLQKVGETDISGENSYWHLELQSDVFCDYSMLLQVCREVEESRDRDPEALDTLIRLASLGKLLPNIQADWIDAYKSEFSIRLIEQLIQISRYDSVRENPPMLFRIAEAILMHDNLDEDAIRMKCTALVRMGKKNQAKQVYDAFVEEFRKALDSEPDFDLADILK